MIGNHKFLMQVQLKLLLYLRPRLKQQRIAARHQRTAVSSSQSLMNTQKPNPARAQQQQLDPQNRRVLQKGLGQSRRLPLPHINLPQLIR